MPAKKRIVRKNIIFLLFGTLITALVISDAFFFRKKSEETLSPTSIPVIAIPPKEEEESSPLFEPTETPANIPAKETFIETPLGSPISIEETGFPDRTCLITDYGAIKGGKASNTDAFGKAIDSCATSGGGSVVVPAGTWLTGPIHLKSNIHLRLKKGARILFDTDFSQYLPVVFSRFEGIEYYNYSAPIYTLNAVNVAITGEGTLDGQGAVWWKMGKWKNAINKLYAMGNNRTPVSERVFGNPEAALRPSFVEFVNCRDVLVEGVRIINGPMWTIHPLYSKNVIIRSVTIDTNPGPSTDGIAVDSSQNVLIENSTFSTGDDAIVLKSGRDLDGRRVHRPTENVIVRHNNVREAHAAVALGSEMSGDIRNVFVSDISADNVLFGFRIKSSPTRGGTVENIIVQNMRMRRVTGAVIQVTTEYEDSPSKSRDALPVIKNVHIRNISAERSDRAVEIAGLSDQPIADISIENARFTTTKSGISIKNSRDIRFDTVSALPTKEALFSIQNGSNIGISNAPCSPIAHRCLSLFGQESHDINIENSGFSLNSAEMRTGEQENINELDADTATNE